MMINGDQMVINGDTLWLFNVANWKITIFSYVNHHFYLP